ncbi:cytochrome b5 domain-containing protein [Clostridium sp. C8-1-8]|uniref:cytochrome b5 domain-containing protein n=1 Tax=Clostridium sp. C8-1-8 TaxID=2698831 RepID=UPI001367B479|nr:cytochrome b5 domain-containing protein [Clostridium sp. C8-1-8]
MRKKLSTLLCAILIFTAFTAIGCTKQPATSNNSSNTTGSSTNNTTNGTNSNKNSTTSTNKSDTTIEQQNPTGKIFTLDELQKYDGKNGNPAYVAVDGVVYDVTHAKNWKNGMHEDGITAGKDLSKEIRQSSHGTSVLKDLTVVGKLKQ